ncbi:hypothetical protein [Xanthomonas arboricola]|uniref:hypothetical protein n=1 Tax=Xanthomonas arboricola TaxID=56448 RepID=UPI0015E3A7C9|nr:hypothetical protein [Xanthomonas arboricola]
MSSAVYQTSLAQRGAYTESLAGQRFKQGSPKRLIAMETFYAPDKAVLAQHPIAETWCWTTADPADPSSRRAPISRQTQRRISHF